MGADSDDDLGPGLHILRERDPLTEAAALAARLGADLCTDLEEADAVIDQRSAGPVADLTALSSLQVLARRLARAGRIADRTRERAVSEVGQRLAGASGGLAVHPTTVRDRAAAVEAARGHLLAAERALADHQAERAAAETVEAAEPPAPPVDTRDAGARRRRNVAEPLLQLRRTRAIGALTLAFGLAMVLVGLDVVPLWAALLVPLVVAFWALRYLQPDVGDPADDEASELLARVAARTDELFGARQADHDLAHRTRTLELARAGAEEEVRVAERAWTDLAGEGVDVADVEEVVARFDPQHEDARLLASQTAGVRAAEVVRHQLEQRWLSAWSDVGLPAPDVADADATIAELRARLGRPVVLVGPATARASELARLAPTAPVVVLNGYVS